MEGKKDNFFFKNILDFHKKEAGICEKDPPTKCAKSYEILQLLDHGDGITDC
jgi:hypothetical protein